MYKKVVLVFSCVCLMNHLVKAENTIFCNAAKDSMSAQFSRGEMGAYIQSKTNANLYNFIKIDKNHYEKRPVRIAPNSNDTSKAAVMKRTLIEFQSKTEKSQPLDSSAEFKRCLNQAFQSKLDSAFKVDFFRKADSIMDAYDKQGKGYKNVEFPGGPGSLQKFLDKNITLPKGVKDNDSDKLVRIYYSFFVDEKGAISEIKLIKSNCKECEAAVLEGINKLPEFTPATDAGKPKKINYILPYTKNFAKGVPPKPNIQKGNLPTKGVPPAGNIPKEKQ